jgi:hypothetical protein
LYAHVNDILCCGFLLGNSQRPAWRYPLRVFDQYTCCPRFDLVTNSACCIHNNRTLQCALYWFDFGIWWHHSATPFGTDDREQSNHHYFSGNNLERLFELYKDRQRSNTILGIPTVCHDILNPTVVDLRQGHRATNFQRVNWVNNCMFAVTTGIFLGCFVFLFSYGVLLAAGGHGTLDGLVRWIERLMGCFNSSFS